MLINVLYMLAMALAFHGQLLGTFVNGDPDFALRPNGKYRVFVLTGAQVLIAKKVLFTLCQGP